MTKENGEQKEIKIWEKVLMSENGDWMAVPGRFAADNKKALELFDEFNRYTTGEPLSTEVWPVKLGGVYSRMGNWFWPEREGVVDQSDGGHWRSNGSGELWWWLDL